MKPPHLIDAAVIDCIANDRDPTVAELFGVAERIWAHGNAERSAFSWDQLPTGSQERVFSLRAAQAAFRGTG